MGNIPRLVVGFQRRCERVTMISDEEVLTRYPGAFINLDNLEYYRGLLQRKVLINRCNECGRWIRPHSPSCPDCWSTDVVPTEVSGRGTIYLFALVRQGSPVADVDFPVPVVAVELAEQEGLRYLSTMIDCANEDISVGMPVEMVWTERDGNPAPAFRPLKEGEE
jgi:uncharacterized OB-fold protein